MYDLPSFVCTVYDLPLCLSVTTAVAKFCFACFECVMKFIFLVLKMVLCSCQNKGFSHRFVFYIIGCCSKSTYIKLSAENFNKVTYDHSLSSFHVAYFIDRY